MADLAFEKAPGIAVDKHPDMVHSIHIQADALKLAFRLGHFGTRFCIA